MLSELSARTVAEPAEHFVGVPRDRRRAAAVRSELKRRRKLPGYHPAPNGRVGDTTEKLEDLRFGKKSLAWDDRPSATPPLGRGSFGCLRLAQNTPPPLARPRKCGRAKKPKTHSLRCSLFRFGGSLYEFRVSLFAFGDCRRGLAGVFVGSILCRPEKSSAKFLCRTSPLAELAG